MTPPLNRLQFGAIFIRAFAMIREAPLPVFGISFLFGSLPQVALNIGQARLLDKLGSHWSTAMDIAGVALGLVLMTLVQGMLTPAAMAHAHGRGFALQKSAAIGLRYGPRLVVLALVNILGVAICSLFLLIPGVLVSLIWSVSASALMAERVGIIGALRRSAYLTRRSLLKIGGLFLLLSSIVIVGSICLQRLATAVGVDTAELDGRRPGSMLYALWTLLPGTAFSGFWAAIVVSLYLELRDWKDGPASDRLADIFA